MFTISLRWLLGMVFVPLKSQDLGDASLTVVSVFIDKKATLFDQFLTIRRTYRAWSLPTPTTVRFLTTKRT